MSIKIKDVRVNASGKIHERGDVVSLKADEEKRLVSLGFATYVDEPKESGEDNNFDTDNITVEDIENMQYQDLKKVAKDLKLDSSGKMEALRERIIESLVEEKKEKSEDEDQGEGPNTSM